MTLAEASNNIGKFCYLVANGRTHYHALHGYIKRIEGMSIIFNDVYEDYEYKFGLNKIMSFELRKLDLYENNIPDED